MSQLFEGSYLGDGSRIADDTRLECGVCWWVYDPVLGDEANQIPPGTPFRLLPATWNCPNCSTEKHKFMVIGSATLSSDDAVQNLANTYRRAALKVKGLPIYHPSLAVEAVGFREHEGRHVGVMVTVVHEPDGAAIARRSQGVGRRRHGADVVNHTFVFLSRVGYTDKSFSALYIGLTFITMTAPPSKGLSSTLW